MEEEEEGGMKWGKEELFHLGVPPPQKKKKINKRKVEFSTLLLAFCDLAAARVWGPIKAEFKRSQLITRFPNVFADAIKAKAP